MNEIWSWPGRVPEKGTSTALSVVGVQPPFVAEDVGISDESGLDTARTH